MARKEKQDKDGGEALETTKLIFRRQRKTWQAHCWSNGEQSGPLIETHRNTHSELTEIRTCPPNRSYIVGMEVTGLALDVEPLPHQALGPRELQVTATHQGTPRH